LNRERLETTAESLSNVVQRVTRSEFGGPWSLIKLSLTPKEKGNILMKKLLGNLVLVAMVALVGVGQAKASVITWSGNGHSYELVTNPYPYLTWQEARTAAQSIGAGWDLATITSSDERSFVISSVLPVSNNSRDEYWLGATDQVTEGTWQWVTNEPFSYTDWHTILASEPDGGTSENYLAIDFRLNNMNVGVWGWNDIGAHGAIGFVAESATVPEPSSFALLGLGGLGLAVGAYRRRRAAAV
jgi:hypothetical protein